MLARLQGLKDRARPGAFTRAPAARSAANNPERNVCSTVVAHLRYLQTYCAEHTLTTEQRAALCDAAGQAFYNTSKFTLRDLKSRGIQQQLLAEFEDYLNGSRPTFRTSSRTLNPAISSRRFPRRRHRHAAGADDNNM
jgi:hypothetical protein